MIELESLRRTIRSLQRSPTYVTVSVLSLGVALGLTTATFALVDGVLHRQLRFADPARLFTVDLRYGNQHQPPSNDEMARVLRVVPAVEDVALAHGDRAFIKSNGVPTEFFVRYVTPNLFRMEGVRLAKGRYPIPSEVAAGQAVVVSERLWTRVFAGRPDIGDASVTVSGHVYSVVGVLPTGENGGLNGDVIVPSDEAGQTPYRRSGSVYVKLRAGVDSAAVRAQLAAVAAGLTSRYVSPNSASPPYHIDLVSWIPEPVKLGQHLFELLLTVLAFGVLLIGCTNVAALGLARGLSRRRDFALRMALGASRRTIATDLIAESAIIALIGGAVGVGVGAAMIGVLTHMVPADFTLWGMFLPSVSGWVYSRSLLALTLGLLVAAGVPAWRASRVSPADPLKDEAGTTTGRSRNEFRLLVIAELAIAMVLLMLTSLVALSTRNILHFDYGFDDSVLLSVRPILPSGGPDSTPAASLQFENGLVRRLRGVTGVAAASLTGFGVLENDKLATDESGDAALPRRLQYYVAGPEYFATAGIPLVQGRDVTEADAAHDGAVVLSQSAARLLFPHGGAVGRMIKLGSVRSRLPWIPIVGIAKDVDLGITDDPTDMITIYADPPPSMFPASGRSTVEGLELLARAPHPNAGLVRDIERDLQDALPPDGVISAVPWSSYRSSAVRQNQFFEHLLSLLSFSALMLASLGLFSVTSYSVGRRMREFAVRQALGATPLDIVRGVLTAAFEMALGGTAIGALLSFWASAGMSWGLFGVKNTDPVSLVIAEGTLMAVALAAALVPAVRAMRANPVEILRSS